ncbi:MAG: hypothetical protein ACFE9I_13865 [Candidatus Hermodarchaeota archaeon]
MLKSLDNIKSQQDPILILIKTNLQAYPSLKRPDKLPKKYKEDFMKYLIELR